MDRQRAVIAELDGLTASLDKMMGIQETVASELDNLIPAILDKAVKGELI
jgi:hypothetical protein